MIQTDKSADLQEIVKAWQAEGLSVALVPTMGALHAGHMSLVALALENADRCVVSIFVNPTQFAPHEDFDSYPRDLEADLVKLEKAGVHLVYTPNEAEIYPNGKESDIKAGKAAEGLETDFRPHFFDGVVNVVYRLFDHVQPNIAVFGEKDYQQLMVIKEMVETLKLPIEIIGAPIARDEFGLALSSRNAYLSDEELAIARKLNVVLKETSLRAQRSDLSLQEKMGLPRRSEDLLAMTKGKLLDAGFDKVDYVSERWNRALAAVWLGKTRLIDNIAK